eukprot:a680230_27.p1 GENE.a680230_27~~a680230_27.p1  ORF type:complete len:244 (+),score=80.65 a680230_27:44-733(+)
MAASDSSDDLQQLHYKVIILGDGAVGKTSIAYRFGKNTFATSYKQTIGLDCFSSQIALPENVDVTISLWDIGGQNLGSKMLKQYIFGAHAILFVYDITSLQSFQNLEDWLEVARQAFEGATMPHMTLVGNKSDMAHMRAIKIDRHREFAHDNGMLSQFVSAKTGDKVSATFTRIAAELAGVALSRPDLEAAQTVVRAEIVDHPAELPPESTDAPVETKKKDKGGKCTVS